MAKVFKSIKSTEATALAKKIKKAKPVKDTMAVVSEAIHICLPKGHPHAELLTRYYNNLELGPIQAAAIYDSTLAELVAQLELLGRFAGVMDLMQQALNKHMEAKDLKLANNVALSLATVTQVINEKFGPRPR